MAVLTGVVAVCVGLSVSAGSGCVDGVVAVCVGLSVSAGSGCVDRGSGGVCRPVSQRR